ncbi:MAG: hypothetical protein ABIX12_06430 [Rubrivivax sp.]
MGINLQSWLGAKRLDRISLARLVSAASPDEAARITQQARAEGHRGFKVAAYGIDLPVDLNGLQFIAEDYLKQPLVFEGQTVAVPQGPGLGIEIDEDKVRAWRLPL